MEEDAGTSHDDHGHDRKRQKNREYRQRRKEEEIKMKNRAEAIGQQNGQLTEENDLLRHFNSLMDQTLKCSNEEYERLKAEFDKLELQHSKKRVLVDTLSDHLASSDHIREENQKLREEHLQLRSRIANGELLQLVAEVAKLRLENTTLEIEKDALCRKIVQEEEEDE